jgi:2-(1,2-epoxy-1,2-dihydrophenyl)acetyl-CoA isomerase
MADDALAIGLVSRVFDNAQFTAEVHSFAASFAQGPAVAYRLIKEAFSKSLNNSFEEQLKLEARLQSEAGKTDDFQEAIAAFAAKRPPVFKGK